MSVGRLKVAMFVSTRVVQITHQALNKEWGRSPSKDFRNAPGSKKYEWPDSPSWASTRLNLWRMLARCFSAGVVLCSCVTRQARGERKEKTVREKREGRGKVFMVHGVARDDRVVLAPKEWRVRPLVLLLRPRESSCYADISTILF